MKKARQHGLGYSLTLVALLIARRLRAFYTQEGQIEHKKQERVHAPHANLKPLSFESKWS